jgi:hypothetical protein
VGEQFLSDGNGQLVAVLLTWGNPARECVGKKVRDFGVLRTVLFDRTITPRRRTPRPQCTELGELSLACAFPFGYYSTGDGQLGMIGRGTCSFLTKWQNAEIGGYKGVLLENSNPGPPIEIGLSPSSNEPRYPSS